MDQAVNYINDWSGHDALIEKIEIDVQKKFVSVRLQAYPDESSKDRKPIEFRFRDVETITTSANLERIEANSFAGTVNHWHVVEGPGCSYFYLVEGYIAITARSAPQLEEQGASL